MSGSDRKWKEERTSGTSLETMRLARPSRMAVLPTPGGPMRTGLDFVRRERTARMAKRLVRGIDKGNTCFGLSGGFLGT
jgi:hypothetical protein